MIDVSAIIVSWNAKEFLLGCLQSLANERPQNSMEIIVVDNASRDGSPELVKQQFPLVKLIRKKVNLGFAKANNIGIRQSSGGYICLINSDITVQKGCIDRMRAYMDEHPSVGILGPKILNKDLVVQSSSMDFPTLLNSFFQAFGLHRILPKVRISLEPSTDAFSYNSARSVEVLSGCFWMIRRDALNQVGLLDENFFLYLEDVDWCKRFHEAEWDVVYFPSAEAIHYGQGSSSDSPARYIRELLRSRLIYWRKHHGRTAQIVIALVSLLHYTLRLFYCIIWYVFKPSSRSKILSNLERNFTGFRWLVRYLLGFRIQPSGLSQSHS
ncbi:MAG: glycosyltransferase family 2 protein [Candidatus Hodarchaeota archaeon]